MTTLNFATVFSTTAFAGFETSYRCRHVSRYYVYSTCFSWHRTFFCMYIQRRITFGSNNKVLHGWYYLTSVRPLYVTLWEDFCRCTTIDDVWLAPFRPFFDEIIDTRCGPHSHDKMKYFPCNKTALSAYYFK